LVSLSASLFLLLPSVPAQTEHGRRLVKAAKSSLSDRADDRAATSCSHPSYGVAAKGEKGDNMVDYEQLTQDVREGLSVVAANKGDKSVEIIMKEILEVLTTACEQHNIDKFEFIQAFYEWYKEKRN
jgi:hypothetical protein